jgi:hypothetical protein
VSLFIKPSFVTEDIGFDKIMVVNTFTWIKETRFSLPRVFIAQKELSEGSDYRLIPTPNDTLLFTFPKVFKKGDLDSIEVRFTTELYWQTQVFYVYLSNSSLSGVWQNCEPENTELTTNEIGIYIPQWKCFYNLEIDPPVFTPNGDGINDATAIHASDVGISVNTATDVAKEAADIVLPDKELETLRDGVVEGRKTFANTLKYVFMATSANFGNMFSAAGAPCFVFPAHVTCPDTLEQFALFLRPTCSADR